MDEEQTLQSPIAGSLRGIRRSISSSVFNPMSRPQPAETDNQTNNLLLQNQLSLNNISSQLEGITKTVTSLNFSLEGIKENLSISDTIEKQREAEKQRREAILAEQGLREGKESALEKKIQSSLQKPLQGIAAKTQKTLFSLQNFFLILAGGWLTNVGIDLLQAFAEGNSEKIKKLKIIFTAGLVGLGATITAISIGIGNTLRLITSFATNAARVAFGPLIRGTFGAAGRLFAVAVRKFNPLIPLLLNLGSVPINFLRNLIGGGVAATSIAGGGKILGEALDPSESKIVRKSVNGKEVLEITGDTTKKASKGKGFFKNIFKNPFARKVGAEVTESGVKTAAKGTFRSLLQKIAAPLKGKGGFLGQFLIDFLIFGEDLDRAIAGAAGWVAGAKIGGAIGASLGALVGGIGAVPGGIIGSIIGGFIGAEGMKSLFSGIKSMFGFGKKKTDDKLPKLTADDMAGEREAIELGLIEPIQTDNSTRADLISQDPDSNVNVLNLGQSAQQNNGLGSMPVEVASNQIPFIPFDESNTAALFATTTFGAPA